MIKGILKYNGVKYYIKYHKGTKLSIDDKHDQYLKYFINQEVYVNVYHLLHSRGKSKTIFVLVITKEDIRSIKINKLLKEK